MRFLTGTLPFQQCFKGIQWHWFSEIIPLIHITALLFERFKLRQSFNPFCYDFKSIGTGNKKYGPQHGFIRIFPIDVFYKTFIDFQFFNRQFIQITQR